MTANAVAMSSSITLRNFQQAACTAVAEAWAAGTRRVLIALPTGTGKTVIASHVIAQRPGRSLTLVHRDELVTQSLDKFRMVGAFDDFQLGVVKAERDDVNAQHVVASIQTLQHSKRLERLATDFATVWVDEAHHAVAASYLDVLEYLGCFGTDGPVVLGTTATPDRLDGLGLEHVFEAIAYEAGLLEMMRQGYLSDIRALRITLDVDLDGVHRRGGDFVESELAHALESAGAPQHAAAAFAEHAQDRKGVLFTASVRLTHETAAALCALGIASEPLDGDTPIELRRAILRRLHTGATRVVTNCQVLTEGFDEPTIDVIGLARPTQSRALYQQMIGRGLRPYPGKSDCLVIDLVGNSTRHELISLASLLGLDPHEVAAHGVLEADERERASRERRAQDVDDGRLVASVVDLLGRRELVWTSVAKAHVLSLGNDGWVGIEPADDGTWRVLQHPGRDFGARLQLVQAELDFGYAMGLAEDMVRRAVPPVLRARDTRWRSRAPTEPRRAYFAHKGWAIPATDGEAADVQNHYFARLAWSRARR
jgi:superfamily II DNA or RNA helicase